MKNTFEAIEDLPKPEMGSSKIAPRPREAGVYRDNPDSDDAASTSSAVLLGDFDSYPEEELPAYTDLPESSASVRKPTPVPRPNGGLVWYEYVSSYYSHPITH